MEKENKKITYHREYIIRSIIQYVTSRDCDSYGETEFTTKQITFNVKFGTEESATRDWEFESGEAHYNIEIEFKDYEFYKELETIDIYKSTSGNNKNAYSQFIISIINLLNNTLDLFENPKEEMEKNIKEINNDIQMCHQKLDKIKQFKTN